jgi:hypothetical protein
MIDMVRRHEVQVLRRAGHSLAETAKLYPSGEGRLAARARVGDPPRLDAPIA